MVVGQVEEELRVQLHETEEAAKQAQALVWLPPMPGLCDFWFPSDLSFRLLRQYLQAEAAAQTLRAKLSEVSSRSVSLHFTVPHRAAQLPSCSGLDRVLWMLSM